MEYDVRDAVETFEVGGGGRIFWRGVREKGGSSEPPEPPLVTGLSHVNSMVQGDIAYLLLYNLNLKLQTILIPIICFE